MIVVCANSKFPVPVNLLTEICASNAGAVKLVKHGEKSLVMPMAAPGRTVGQTKLRDYLHPPDARACTEPGFRGVLSAADHHRLSRGGPAPTPAAA